MKLLYFIDFLHTPGGMERVLTLKANYLADILGYEVHIACLSKPQKPFFDLSKKIQIHFLSIENYHINLPKKIVLGQYYTPEHYQKVEKIIQKVQPNISISFLGNEFYFLYKINDKSAKVVEFHNSRESHTIQVETERLGLLKKIYRQYLVKKMIKVGEKYNKTILLSERDKKSWGFTNAEVIPNPLTYNPIEECIDYSVKKVIACGRISYQKGFDLLVQSWAIVAKRYPDWKLTILGRRKGVEDNLDEQIKELGLESTIQVLTTQEDVIQHYIEHSIFVLSSRYEGFGMVLTEAACCGLPLVSFDCPSGPAEIIEDGKTGYIAENLNINDLAQKLMLLMNDEEKRKEMGLAAKKSMEKYSIDLIMNQWNSLFLQISN